jgi:carbon storage regulator
MLVVNRRVDEVIQIGSNVFVTVVSIDRGKVRLGIEAPKDVEILRTELLARRNEESSGDDI